ncbi:hypothetical protein [Rhodococcus sp. SJ-2]
MRPSRVSAPILTFTAIMLTACNSGPVAVPGAPRSEIPGTGGSSTPATYSVPENLLNSTLIWSSEPGIDLFSEEATLTRAAIEANVIALAGSSADSYPGFDRAIDQETRSQYAELSRGTAEQVGTGRYHIARIELTDTGFIAHTCRQNANVAAKNSDGRYSSSVTTGEHNPRFVFERTPTDTPPTALQPTEPTATPPTDDTGQPQWQAPTYDVFTGWNINIDGSSGRDHTHACRQWGHQYAPDAIENDYFVLTTDTPPDTLPAYPGW